MKALGPVMLQNSQLWFQYIYIYFKTKHIKNLMSLKTVARQRGKEATMCSFEKDSFVANVVDPLD